MSVTGQGAQPPSSILTVCTGNICRSPLAGQLIRTRLQDLGVTTFEVVSAGLHAAVGAPMEPFPAALSREYGGNPEGSVGRQISAEMVDAAALVLTMTRKQRDELVKKYPGAAQRAFTMAEFARSAANLPAGEGTAAPAAASWASVTGAATNTPLAGLVSRAAAVRSTAGLRDEDDIPDPINATEAVHRDVARRIAGHSNEVAEILRKHL
ncbi:low molecular weight phosphatase family protein [Arthrobacter sp. StoSoilB20]|uniref:arsenate reductase/protein-tyrosine-phosphatase family protein n=1 Tax=Arthrobacter sp. StoSoilB20 TaxID=2830995 RepID=UPI001CC3335A|nr:low molecular weight phosphatase family protein [Arthrobacter sp. StoSoilB20]BCW59997.1 low molecular weight phosphatase family protein [Arthrobacter sp. StoSoilB20]